MFRPILRFALRSRLGGRLQAGGIGGGGFCVLVRVLGKRPSGSLLCFERRTFAARTEDGSCLRLCDMATPHTERTTEKDGAFFVGVCLLFGFQSAQ